MSQSVHGRGAAECPASTPDVRDAVDQAIIAAACSESSLERACLCGFSTHAVAALYLRRCTNCDVCSRNDEASAHECNVTWVAAQLIRCGASLFVSPPPLVSVVTCVS